MIHDVTIYAVGILVGASLMLAVVLYRRQRPMPPASEEFEGDTR